MPRVLVVGTNNRHKAVEIAPLLDGLGLTLRAAGAYGPFRPVEDGATLEANAWTKARAAMELSGEWAIADDTGLEVDALGGRPGLHAARFAGPQCDFDANIRQLLAELGDAPAAQRTARFVCTIALARPGAGPAFFRGQVEGRILDARRGVGGFGYDPVFLVEALGKTMAELTLEEKNRISHRGQAVRRLRAALAELLAGW